MAREFGHQFFTSGTATTTETTAANSLWHTQDGADGSSPPVNVRRIIISNDELAGGTALRYRFSTTTGVDKATLAGGETVTIDVRTPSIFFDTASGTAAYRAWGLG
jgi:hypothetical protein